MLFKLALLSTLLIFSLVEATPVENLTRNNEMSHENYLKARIYTSALEASTRDLNFRTLNKVSEKDISRYVTDAVDRLPSANKIYDERYSQTSTAIWRPFYRNSKDKKTSEVKRVWEESFNIGLKYLTGCTSIVIISLNGVYAAHFFEDQSMADSAPKTSRMAIRNLLHDGGPDFQKLSLFVSIIDAYLSLRYRFSHHIIF